MRSVVVLFVVACSSSTPAPPPSSPSGETAPPVVELDAPPPPPAPDAAELVDAAEPAPIACKTDDDCWIDDDGKLVERPKAKRGKKLKPCKDSSRLPLCEQSVCVINAYKC